MAGLQPNAQMDMMKMFMAQMRGGVPQNPGGAEDPNVKFYRNEIQSQPDGDLVEHIHNNWDGDWERLEYHHGYIQWLFPVFEAAGMNFESVPLSKSGAALIRADEAAQRRVLASYKLMLRFYGFELEDERTGVVGRLQNQDLYRQQIRNFNLSAHNFLRISRILVSLGELGFHRYKRPFLERLQAEVDDGALSNARRSLADFWAPLVHDEGSDGYTRKTLEDEADREEGCLFKAGGPLA